MNTSLGGTAYDRDTTDRRAVSRVGFWFAIFVVGSFAFAYAWNLYVGPYSTFYTDRSVEQRKAATYLTTTACTDDGKRSQLEGYNQCERSERIVTQRLAVMAFFDLMDHLRVCDKGVCTVGGINITSSAWFLFQLILAAAALLYIVSFFGLASSMYGRHTGAYQMPMTMGGAQMSAYYAALEQKRQTDALASMPPSRAAESMPLVYTADIPPTIYGGSPHYGKQE